MTDMEEKALKTIGRLIAEARLDHGAKLLPFAKEAGVDVKTLRGIEAGRQLPHEVTQRKLERALGWRKGSIQQVLDDMEHLDLDKITIASMQEGAAEASWEDLFEGTVTDAEQPVDRARELTNAELIAELAYRLRNNRHQ